MNNFPFSTSAALASAVGVNTHLNYYDLNYANVPLVVSQLKDLGVTRVRDGFHTTVTSQTTPNFDGDSRLYSAWKAIGELGIKFSTVLDPSEKLGPMTAATLNTLYFECGQLVGQFEGPNEPDNGTPVGWPTNTVAFQQQVYAAVQGMAQSFLGIPVLAPSLALPVRSPQVGWPNPVPFNSLNWHYYPGNNLPNFAIQSSIASLQSWGKLPIQVSEFGYSNAINAQATVDEATAAQYILRGIIELWAAGVEGIYLYELQDAGADPALTNIEDHWGLVRWDGSYKPAFFAISNLLDLLKCGDKEVSDTSIGYTLGGPSVSSLVLQHKANEWLLFLWQEAPVWDQATNKEIVVPPVAVPITFDVPSMISLYSPLQQKSPMQYTALATNVTVNVPAYPVVLKITQ